MADTIFTRALIQAAELHGSTQVLASQLRVPENTLLRWMSGRAMMPVKAFRALMEVLKGMDTHPIDAADASPHGLFDFAVGDVSAFCAACNGTRFKSTTPASTLCYRSTLACVACGQTVVLADLLAQLAEHYGRFAVRRKNSGARALAVRRAAKDGSSSIH